MLRPALSLLLLLVPALAFAQWTNRYPRNAGFGHHVYLEGYELPIMAAGPGDPAPSPDGRTLAVTSRGWLWVMDPTTGTARRLTSGAGVDSRPAWSPDGRQLAFVRDNSRTLAVVLRDMTTGAEREVDQGMAMDPAFTPDGRTLVYTNIQPGGDLDLWAFDLASGARTRLTTEAGLELRPLPLAGGQRLVYTSKTRGGGDQVRLRTLADSRESALLTGNIVSQARPAASPDGHFLAYNWPGSFGWELRLMSLDRPGVSVLLYARPRGRPLAPAWSADGEWIYFSEGDANQRLRFFRVSRHGGPAHELPVTSWDYGAPVGRVLIHTGGPARLHAVDAQGHPLVPATGMARFDGQNGRIYFYSSGTLELEAPAGSLTIEGVRGLATPPARATATVTPGQRTEVTLAPTAVWDAAANGWYSGDHHFHLNYGGQFDLAPADLLVPMRGEDLDVGTPMLANLHNRYENQDQWRFEVSGERPIIDFAQEVRSHFLGHVGLIGTSELVWPWTWGPGYEVYGRDDRTNAEPLAKGRQQGGLGVYVHPTTSPAPFTEAGRASVPVELVADAVHGAFDLLEVVCLWSNAVGTTELWYRFLNAGLPIMPSGGTDVMTDLHRTMAVGATRVFVRPEGAMSYPSYLAALRAGRTFVTTGPLLDLRVGGAQPGDVIAAGRDVEVSLGVHSAMPVDSIALVVNGRTVWSVSGPAPAAPFSQTWTARVRVPAGGWIAARVTGPAVDRWPAMAYTTFAHTAPIWLGSRGSTEGGARRAAAQELLLLLESARQRLDAGYQGTEIPKLHAHFDAARSRLEALAR